MKYDEAETILETYSLEEILEMNELTEADALCYLVEEEFIQLPEQLPIDI